MAKPGDVLYLASSCGCTVLLECRVDKVARKYFYTNHGHGVINLIDNPPSGAMRGFFTSKNAAESFESSWKASQV